MIQSRDQRIGEVILDLRNISLAFGGVKALTDISFDVREHEIRAIIGPNGAGKSSMLNVINGVYTPQEGSITLDGKRFTRMNPRRAAEAGIARTFQSLALFKGMSVLDNILLGRHNFMRPSVLGSLFYWWWAQKEEVRQRAKVEEIIDLLQLESVRDEMVEYIPLGLQKRVELARALASEPRFLVLDEPMAGMNQEEKEYMVRFILDAHEALGLTILLIEHHMDVVTAICDRLVVLNNGVKIKEGTPHETINDPAVVAAYIGKVNHAA